MCVVQAHDRLSTDWVSEGDDQAYGTELLNQQTVGLPPHKLTLKIGMPVMLLRNMNSGTLALTNGTRMVVKHILRQNIMCEIATGEHTGTIVPLARITLEPSQDVLPFKMKRRQFPIRPCFGMTINKAQGQTLQRVFGYLPRSCFSHGQYYVMVCRVGAEERVKLFVPQRLDDGTTVTENVVYTEVLLH